MGRRPGTYVLVLHVNANLNLKTRSKNFQIQRGYYVYVGSALSDLDARIKRHERTEKRNFWHIDFLLAESELIFSIALVSPTRLEDTVAAACRGTPISGFGASDSKLSSHLFWYPSLSKALSDAFRALERARSQL